MRHDLCPRSANVPPDGPQRIPALLPFTESFFMKDSSHLWQFLVARL